jgi:cytochrome c
MRKLLFCLTALALAASVPAFAVSQASPDDAKSMAIKAAEYLRSAGPDRALPEFNAKDNTWHDRDLYVIVENSKGVVLAHGSNLGLIGRSVLDLRDVDGKAFGRELVAVADAGWVNFKWMNPITKALERKTEYIVHVGDYFVGVGAYVR